MPAAAKVSNSCNVSSPGTIRGRTRTRIAPPPTPIASPTPRPTNDVADDRPPGAGAAGRKIEQTKHERDRDRIVGAGLRLKNHARPPAEFPAAQQREHNRRVCWRECGTDNRGRRPAEPEEDVRNDRHRPRSRERADHAEQADRDDDLPQPLVSDIGSSVKENHDQRDSADPAHVPMES